MIRLSRPWQLTVGPNEFGPKDCLLSEFNEDEQVSEEGIELMRGVVNGETRILFLHPYPVKSKEDLPSRSGFLPLIRTSHEPTSPEGKKSQFRQRHIDKVFTRVQELKGALDDPPYVWKRLRSAWEQTEQEENPYKAAIVDQATEMIPILKDLESRKNLMLRRVPKRVPINRVQEMDRNSMLWLIRQPGKNIKQRAGSEQRIMAITRQDNFDTLENRVLCSYLLLAADVAREWLDEQNNNDDLERIKSVRSFLKRCRSFYLELKSKGVGCAPAGETPNYVLMEDHSYRKVFEAWEQLLKRKRIFDDLWAWQAEIWSDFVTLAIVMAIDGLEYSETVAQSPIFWLGEAKKGRLFVQDTLVATFWLKTAPEITSGAVVEIFARQQGSPVALTLVRAHISLRITPLQGEENSKLIAVWAPHSLEPLNLDSTAQEAADSLLRANREVPSENLQRGIIVTPSHSSPEEPVIKKSKSIDEIQLSAIAFDASGKSLVNGIKSLDCIVQKMVLEIIGELNP